MRIFLDEDDTKLESETRWPGCVVTLVGEDGNSMAMVGRVGRALRRYLQHDGRFSPYEIKREVKRFTTEALSSDYDHVLQTCMAWVTVE